MKKAIQKTLAVFLVITFVLSLCACGKKDTTESKTSANSGTNAVDDTAANVPVLGEPKYRDDVRLVGNTDVYKNGVIGITQYPSLLKTADGKYYRFCPSYYDYATLEFDSKAVDAKKVVDVYGFFGYKDSNGNLFDYNGNRIADLKGELVACLEYVDVTVYITKDGNEYYQTNTTTSGGVYPDYNNVKLVVYDTWNRQENGKIEFEEVIAENLYLVFRNGNNYYRMDYLGEDGEIYADSDNRGKNCNYSNVISLKTRHQRYSATGYGCVAGDDSTLRVLNGYNDAQIILPDGYTINDVKDIADTGDNNELFVLFNDGKVYYADTRNHPQQIILGNNNGIGRATTKGKAIAFVGYDDADGHNYLLVQMDDGYYYAA